MRALLTLFFVLFFGLGCMGAVNSLTGLDLDIRMEADALHPADFEAQPVNGGTKLMSMGMTAAAENLDLPADVVDQVPSGTNYRMEMITYGVPREDVDARVATARGQVEASGFAVSGTESEVDLFAKGDTLFIVFGEPGDGPDQDGVVTLIRLRPVTE